MKVIGVIGQIGAGKSRICNALGIQSKFRARIINLDDVARSLRMNPTIVQRLVEAFGYNGVDSGYILDVVFPNDKLYKQLSDIYSDGLYDYMTKEIEEWGDAVDVLVFEGAPLIHNERLLGLLDNIIWVNTPADICYNRVKDRNKYTLDQIQWLLSRTNPTVGFAFSHRDAHSAYKISSVDGCDIQRLLNWVEKKAWGRYDMNGKSVVIYPGTFDPFHLGHLATVNDLLRTFDTVVIVRCINGAKDQSNRFPLDPTHLPAICEVVEWDRSFVEYVELFCTQYKNTKVTIARGIRNGTDLIYEQDYIKHLEDMYRETYGKELPPVLFVPSDRKYQHISSSGIKALLPFQPEYANSLMV